MITRYNLYPTAALTGAAAPGTSSGHALGAVDHLAEQTLPPGISDDRTGIAYQERQVGGRE